MTRTLLILIALSLAGTAGLAQTPKPVDLHLAQWSAQSQKPSDGKATVTAEAFTLTRGPEGDDGYMLRVSYDLPARPGGLYLFTYSVKVEGEGGAAGILFSGDAQGAWDEAHARNTEQKRKCDFTPVKTILAASQSTVKFRLDLRAFGANTTVTYKDVRLEEIGEQQDVVLTPSDAAVTLDGRLDDPLWATAARLSPFRVLGAVESPAAVSNEALVALRDGYLYVAYRLAEPNVAGMKATKPAGGPAPIGIYNDDCAETFLSTDQVAFSHVIVNAAGARHWDQQSIGHPSATWYPTTTVAFNPDWEAKAAVGKSEWTCEMRVRLSDLYGEAVGGERKLYANFTRHRTQGAEENLTYAPIAGKFYAVPREFVPITLRLPPLAGPVASRAIPGKFTSTLTVPDLLLAGAPVKLATRAGAFKLPANPTVAQKGVAIDAGVLRTLSQALTVPAGGAAQVIVQVGDPLAGAALTPADRAKMKSPEAFRLDLAPGKATITGRTRDGALRGIATLILMANRARLTKAASLPALTLFDAPRLPFRGLMVQLDRRIVDVAFLLRINKLLVYLDSFGGPTLFPFESYPIGSKRTTKQELVDLFNYARARGIEPIPYFASWGRVQYLKVMPGGKDLLVDDVDVLQQGYRNLDVANPETHKVMLALQQEIIDTLHPKSFCIAMDEAHFGHMVASAAAKAKGWKPSDWFAEALNVNAAFFRKQGIRMIIWGDMIEPTHNGPAMDVCGPPLLARLPKEMTIFDWEYSGSREVTEEFPSIRMFREAGLPTIGCPWFAPKGVARLAHSIAKLGGEGLLLTAWNSSSPEAMPTEWIRACSLTAYFGWSPQDCDLGHLPFVPDAIMQGAAYWQRVNTPAGPTRSVAAPQGLVTGGPLAKLLGLPAGTDPGFLATPFRNVRGARVDVFRQDGKPAAVALAGRDCAVVRNGDFSKGLAGWSADTLADDTLFVGEKGALKATRVAGNAFRRVSQDLRLDPKREYIVRYRAKVEGPGMARAWTYSGDEKFRWNESKSVHSAANERDWAVKEMPLPPGFAALRISLTVDGAGTTAWFDDIEVVEKGVDPATLAPAKAVLPVGAPARVVTFLHATSRQVLHEEDMHGNAARYASIVPGEYRVHYADGTMEVIPLTYRVNIVAANDPTLGRETDVGLFGTVGGAAFMNLPTFTWPNPHPDKRIVSIEARSGSSSEMTLLLFGVALE